MSITVTVLGSADAFNSAGRGNAGYLVEDARGALCVDFGPTALQALKRAKFDVARLDAVLLTHLHGDHFGGLHLLMVDAQYRQRRTRPLWIGGPPGTRERVELWYELAYRGSGAKRPYEVRYEEWAPGARGHLAERAVSTYAANHMGGKGGALHLRLETGGAKLAFSGDTGWSENLEPLARGADLLVLECSDYTRVSGEHLAWTELAPRLEELGAKRIVLTHFSDAMRSRLGRLKAPRVRFAEDGLRIRLRGK